jgi:AcrR family transcriptional regulator
MRKRMTRREATPRSVAIRAQRADRKRDDILRAGLRVFARKGFSAATMDDIAIELEATRGFLYYYFKTKDEILEAIIANNDLISGIEKGFDLVSTMPLREALQFMVRGSLALMEANGELVRFLQVQALLSTQQAEVVYTKVLDRLEERAAQALQQRRLGGEIRADTDPRHFARMIVDLVISYFIKRQLFGAREPADSGYLDRMLETLQNGVAAQSKPCTLPDKEASDAN